MYGQSLALYCCPITSVLSMKSSSTYSKHFFLCLSLLVPPIFLLYFSFSSVASNLRIKGCWRIWVIRMANYISRGDYCKLTHCIIIIATTVHIGSMAKEDGTCLRKEGTRTPSFRMSVPDWELGGSWQHIRSHKWSRVMGHSRRDCIGWDWPRTLDVAAL